jgi:hypothetical protein
VVVLYGCLARIYPGRLAPSFPVGTSRAGLRIESNQIGVIKMARDPFSSSSGGAQLRGYVGRLGLFTPQEFVPGAVNGKFGRVDGVRADVVFLDDGEDEPLTPDEAEAVDGMLVINGPVVNELKGKIGNSRAPMHLGRVKAIENKKGGQSDVIVLDPPSDADKEAARSYLAWLEGDKADPFAE